MQQKSYSTPYLLSGYTCLILAAYLDNIRGPLIPIISKELHINFSETSIFVSLGNVSACVITILLLFLLRRFSERKTMLIVAASTGVFLTSSMFTTNLWLFYIFSAAIGASIVQLGTMSNIMTIKGCPADKRGNILASLHTMYGISSMLSPFLIFYLFKLNIHWNQLFLLVIPLLIPLIYISYFKIEEKGPTPQAPISLRELNWQHLSVILFIMIYTNGELLTSMWMSTYLNGFHLIPLEDTTIYLSGFFFILAISRLATFFFNSPERENKFVYMAIFIPLVSFALSYFFELYYLFPFVGFVGPFFPIMLSKISKKFPSHWQILTIGIVIFQQSFGSLCHFTIGYLTDEIGIRTAFLIPGLLLTLTFILLPKYLKILR